MDTQQSYPSVVDENRFFVAYSEDNVVTPPWVIDRPQPELVNIIERCKSGQGEPFCFAEPVLDLGCGYGDNAVFFAQSSYRTLALDFVPEAVAMCRKKAEEKNVQGIQFLVADATKLEDYPEVRDGDWKTVTDSALFHTFSDEMRVKYLDSLGKVIKKGCNLILFCFSDKEQRGPALPRRVRKEEIESYFSQERGWTIKEIRPAFYADRVRGEAHAWLAFIQKN